MSLAAGCAEDVFETGKCSAEFLNEALTHEETMVRVVSVTEEEWNEAAD